MQNKKTKLIAILAIFILLILNVSYATEVQTLSEEAKNEASEGTYISTPEEDQVATTNENSDMVKKDYFYMKADDLVLSDTIDSNAFIIANNVTITNEIGGDLFVMANSVKLDGGYVYGNVFVFAKDFTLNATVYDIYAFCTDFKMEYDGVAYRDLRVFAENVSISGGVGRNSYITAKNISLDDEALLYGDFNYSAPNAIVIKDGVVKGDINYNENVKNVSVSKSFKTYVISLLTVLVFTLAIYGLMILLAPNFYSKLSEIKLSKIFLGIAIGLLSLIVVPVVAIILAFTTVGATLTLAILVLYVLVLMISSAIAYITIGTFISNRLGNSSKMKNLVFIALTTIAFFLIDLIPFIGGLVSFLIVLSGFGILVLTIINKKSNVNE